MRLSAFETVLRHCFVRSSSCSSCWRASSLFDGLGWSEASLQTGAPILAHHYQKARLAGSRLLRGQCLILAPLFWRNELSYEVVSPGVALGPSPSSCLPFQQRRRRLGTESQGSYQIGSRCSGGTWIYAKQCFRCSTIFPQQLAPVFDLQPKSNKDTPQLTR